MGDGAGFNANVAGAMALALFPVPRAFTCLLTAMKPLPAQQQGTQPHFSRYPFTITMEDNMLKGIALWAMGVPVVVIILLYMFVF